MFNNSLTAE